MTDLLISPEQLSSTAQKARLEGTIGYITYLLNCIGNKQYKTVEELKEALQSDAQDACGSLAPLLVEELKQAGAECGLMSSHTQPTK